MVSLVSNSLEFLHFTDKVGHVFANLSGVSCVVICDMEYPPRVAFGLVNQLLDELMNRYSLEQIMSGQDIEFPETERFLSKYQNPSEADSIMRVQKELDETKVVLHRTLESLLERGEKLDDLVARSDQLGVHSKAFYKAAKKTNSCCVVQ